MVGPEASASGVLSGTSDTSSETCCAGYAACASRPPFTAERCFRTALISAIGAPECTRARYVAIRSSSEISSSMGFSTIDDPPPLIRKITSAEAGCASSDSQNRTRSVNRIPHSASDVRRENTETRELASQAQPNWRQFLRANLPDLGGQRFDHGVSRLAQRHHQHTRIRVQDRKDLAHPQNPRSQCTCRPKPLPIEASARACWKICARCSRMRLNWIRDRDQAWDGL